MLEYDLAALKPSQERRLVSELSSNSGRERFLSKLGNLLKRKTMGGGEGRDITELAMRLSSLGVWRIVSVEDLNQVLGDSRPGWVHMFIQGLPASVKSKLRFKATEPETERQSGSQYWLGGKSAPNPVHNRSASSRREQLIAKYADDLRKKCGVEPDMELLTKVTIACGPSIYQKDLATIAARQKYELETVKNNFLIKKLGMTDSPALMEAINSVIDIYGRSERHKYRAVIYYLLMDRFFGLEENSKSPRFSDSKRSKALDLLS